MKLISIYRKLLARFGRQDWWPADTPFEVVAGAVLTQNANWGNAEKAVANLKRLGMLTPEKIVKAGMGRLERLIMPSGFYRQKARTLKRVARFFLGGVRRKAKGGGVEELREEFLGDARGKAKAAGIEGLRRELLKINGVGEETADSILLYALDLPVFVIDAYTIRFCARHGLVKGARRDKRDYERYRRFFERNLPRDAGIYNEFHALLVRLAKEKYRKREALCGECPVRSTTRKSLH